MNKTLMIHWAEVLDSFRIIPRLFLVATFVWTVELSWYLLHWYTTLPAAARGIEASGFASIVFLAVLGFMKLVFDTYVAHGRDWNSSPATTTTVASMTTTATTPVTPTTTAP